MDCDYVHFLKEMDDSILWMVDTKKYVFLIFFKINNNNGGSI